MVDEVAWVLLVIHRVLVRLGCQVGCAAGEVSDYWSTCNQYVNFVEWSKLWTAPVTVAVWKVE